MDFRTSPTCPFSRLALHPTTPARLTAHDSVETCLETYETTGHRILDAHSSLYPSAATRAILPSMDSIPLYLIDAARGPASTNRTVPERACRVSAKDLQDTKQHEHANTDACHVNGAIMKRELLCFPPGGETKFPSHSSQGENQVPWEDFFFRFTPGETPPGEARQKQSPTAHTRPYPRYGQDLRTSDQRKEAFRYFQTRCADKIPPQRHANSIPHAQGRKKDTHLSLEKSNY